MNRVTANKAGRKHVWLVVATGYEDHKTLAAFSDPSSASEYAEHVTNQFERSRSETRQVSVECFEVDPGERPGGWRVWVDMKGRLDGQPWYDDDLVEVGNDSWPFYDMRDGYGRTVGGCGLGHSYEEALEAARVGIRSYTKDIQ